MNKLEKINKYHSDALGSLILADQALAKVPNLVIDGPHLQSDVTQAWLQAELGGAVEGAHLDTLVVEDEHSGMTSRKKWRLQWNDIGKQADLPNTLFVKATPDEPAHREMLAILHMHELEANFYKYIQPDVADISPKAYYSESYPGGHFLIALEDLSERDCKPYWLKDLVGIEHIRAVTIALAKLHATFWESERLQGDLSWVRPRTCRYGWPWLNSMTSEVRRAFHGMADESILPKKVGEVLLLWDEHADSVFDYFETLPHTVLHGDTHLGNTFSYPDGSAGLFDWQVMFSGHGLRDFVYFIFSALTEEERQVHEKELFTLYIQSLADNGVSIDSDEAWNLYCLFVLDRWDAGITAFVHGTYNHDLEAQRRGFLATNGSIIDNDIEGKLKDLINNCL